MSTQILRFLYYYSKVPTREHKKRIEALLEILKIGTRVIATHQREGHHKEGVRCVVLSDGKIVDDTRIS